MVKINNSTTYPVTTPTLLDRLIGTDRSNTIHDSNGETVQFQFDEILNLFRTEIQTSGIDGTTIGASTPAAGSFTTGTFSGAATVTGYVKALDDIRFLLGTTYIGGIERSTSNGSVIVTADPGGLLADSHLSLDVDGQRYVECQGGFIKFGNYGTVNNYNLSGTNKGQVWAKQDSTSSVMVDIVGDTLGLRMNRASGDGDTIQFRRSGSAVGSISVTATATAYNTSSDRRLKQDIRPLDNGLALLAALRPRRFAFIRDPLVPQIGWIAQELLPVVPSAVTVPPDDEFMSVDGSKIVPILAAALQEAVALIEDLQVRVKALEGG